MPVLFLIVSLAINSIIINDTLLFISDSPVTTTHFRTMTCYLHLYTCDVWHPLSNPNIGVCSSIYFCVHCKICISDKLQLPNIWPADHLFLVIVGCISIHIHPLKCTFNFSGNKIDIFTQHLLLQCIIWFQLSCKPLPNWSVKLTTKPYNYFYFC